VPNGSARPLLASFFMRRSDVRQGRRLLGNCPPFELPQPGKVRPYSLGNGIVLFFQSLNCTAISSARVGVGRRGVGVSCQCVGEDYAEPSKSTLVMRTMVLILRVSRLKALIIAALEDFWYLGQMIPLSHPHVH
jgi:hypothetical protein